MTGQNPMRAWSWVAVVSLVALAVGCSGAEQQPEAKPTLEQPADAAGAEKATENKQTPPAFEPPQSTGDSGVDNLMEEMSRDELVRRKEGRYFFEQGERAFEDADYVKAESLYRKALDRDPSLAEAKRKLISCLMFQGKRDGEIATTIQEFADSVKVANQERASEARRLVNEGQKAYDDGDLELAIQKLKRAREMYLWNTYRGLDVGADQERAETLFNEVRQQYEAAQRQARLDQEERASENARALREQDEQRRRDRVARLMRDADRRMDSREYDKAVEIYDSVLDLDPRNKTARKMMREATDLAHDQRYVRAAERDDYEVEDVWINAQESGVPYDDPFTFGTDPEYWVGVVRRRETHLQSLDLEESFEVTKIRDALNTLDADFEFDDQALSEVVAFFRTISDLNITIDPDIDSEETKVDLKLSNVKLQEALNLILENTGLAYAFRENTLYITTPDKAHGNTFFDIYNVTDILNKIRDFPGPVIRVRSNDEVDDSGTTPFGFDEGDDEEEDPMTPEELAELIQKSTGGEDLWEEAQSRIEGHRGQLLVTATRELHIAIKNFLGNLRKDSDLFVIVEARFIDLFDDFLEDIGIDTRNLGQPPGTGFGTAYGIMNTAFTGGTDQGFNNLGNPNNPSLLMGQDRVAGRVQHVLDGFAGAVQGTRLDASLRGLTLQATWLDPFQINAILRATHEERQARIVTAPRVTASNGQRVHVSVITQRAYVQDYELVSGGTGLVVQEVADPVVSTFQEGVILDVQPVISSDRKYVTIDVRPTLASLINGIISTVTISLGSLQQAATQVDIDLPEISLQQAFTSVTVPDGGTVLLGGFRSLNERKYESFIPLVGRVPIVKNLFRRKAYIDEKRSLYVLLTARVVDLRAAERQLYN